MHVALVVLWAQGVELLLHLEHVQGSDTQDLSLTPLEDCGTVNARDDLYFSGDRTDIAQTTAVDTNLLAQDALTNQLLGNGTKCARDFLAASFELLSQLLGDSCVDLIQLGFALLLSSNCQRGCKLILRGLFNGGVDIILVIQVDREFCGWLCSNLCQFHLCFAQDTDKWLSCF